MRTTRRAALRRAAAVVTFATGATVGTALPGHAAVDPVTPPALPSWVHTAGDAEADPGYGSDQTDWARRDRSTTIGVEGLLAAAGVAAVADPQDVDGLVAVRNVDGAPQVQTVHATGLTALRRAVARLQADPSVVSLSANRRSRVVDTRAAAPTCGTVPGSASQWDRSALKLQKVAGQGVTGAGATVAVIDSGVNGNTPGLKGQVLQGTDLVGTGNGWKDEVGHGTHVAGTVAARGTGLTGVAPGAKILPVRVADGQGFAYDSDTAAGIQYAVKHGAQILNLSLVGDRSPAVATMIKYALGRHVLVAAAAGNDRDYSNPVRYPAAYPGVLGVAATQPDRTSASFSEAHNYVRIAAPGTEIVSTFPTGADNPKGLCTMEGTSMASPHIAGAAALLYQASGHKVVGSKAVTVLIGTTADAEAPGYDIDTGYGIVDPVAAVAKARCYAAGRCRLPLANVRRNAGQRWVQRASVTLTGSGPRSTDLLTWPRWVAAGTRRATDYTYPRTTAAYYDRRAVQQYLYSAARRSGPDSSVAYYSAKLAGGTTQQQLYALLLATPEAYRRSGGTDSRWVAMAYRETTGHPVSAASRSFYLKRLGHGASRRSIALSLVNSSAGLGRLVDAQYERFLGRMPTATARSYWVKKLQAGVSMRSVSANLVASAEYRAKS